MQQLYRQDAKAAKKRKSLTAKDAMDAEAENCLTARDAEAAEAEYSERASPSTAKTTPSVVPPSQHSNAQELMTKRSYPRSSSLFAHPPLDSQPSTLVPRLAVRP